MGIILSWNTILLLTQDDGQNPYTVSDPKYGIQLPEPYRISEEASFNAQLSAAERSA